MKFNDRRIRQRDPLVQASYAMLAAVKKLADDAELYCGVWEPPCVDPDELWESLAPFREALNDADGTTFAAKYDAMSDDEIIETLNDADRRMRESFTQPKQFVQQFDMDGYSEYYE